MNVSSGVVKIPKTVKPATAPSAAIDEIVLWTAGRSSVHGAWSVRNDTTAAGSAAVGNPDAGAPKAADPSASPASYVDITFNADAGKPYHLWLRLKADNDDWRNDSVWLQFSGSVDAAGNPVNRIGTTSGTWVSLEECSGCGEQGWGWQDNAYGSRGDLGPSIYFAASGPQTIRMQIREDGLSVDQIVLSNERYRDRHRAGDGCESCQRLEIGGARAGAIQHRGIDHLLATHAHAAESPPDRRVKPEDGLDQLLGEDPQPVATLDVKEFVTHDRPLSIHRQIEEGSW